MFEDRSPLLTQSTCGRHHRKHRHRQHSQTHQKRQKNETTEPQKFPEEFNLCDKVYFIWDQGKVGACTAHASIILFMMIRAEAGYSPLVFSRRWLYFMVRFVNKLRQQNGGKLPDNWYDQTQSKGSIVTDDQGAISDDCLQVIVTKGCPLESSYPYITHESREGIKTPSESLKIEAARYIPPGGAKLYVDRENGRADGLLLDPASLLDAIKTQLYRHRRPVIVGFRCYGKSSRDELIRLDSRGFLKIPKKHKKIIEAHEIVIVGWDDRHQCLVCLNFWGNHWGIQPHRAKTRGYFYMSYKFAFHVRKLHTGAKQYDQTSDFRTLVMDPFIPKCN